MIPGFILTYFQASLTPERCAGAGLGQVEQLVKLRVPLIINMLSGQAVADFSQHD
jgi:hypothetical protein